MEARQGHPRPASPIVPDHNSELRIVNEVLKAQTSSAPLTFTFAKCGTIDDALRARLHVTGCTVRGVLDSQQSAHEWSPHPERIAAGACLRQDTLPDQAKLHHTLLVLVDQVAIGGSFNYTSPANQYNDENLFIIRNASVAQPALPNPPRAISPGKPGP